MMKNKYLTIDQWLKEDELSIKDVADKLGISRQHLNSIRNGEPVGRVLGYRLWLLSGKRLSLIKLLYPPDEISKINQSIKPK